MQTQLSERTAQHSAQLEQVKREAANKSAALEKQLDAVHRELECKTKALAEATDKSLQTLKEIADARQEIVKLNGVIEQLRADAEKLKGEAIQSDKSWNDKHSAVASQLEVLQKDLSEKRGLIEKYVADIQCLRKENDQKEETVNAVSENLEKIMKDHTLELNKLKKEFVNSETNLKNTMASQLAEKANEVKVLKETLREKDAMLQKSSDKSGKDDRAFKELQAKLTKSEENLTKILSEKASLEKSVDSLSVSKKELSASCADLEHQLSSEKNAKNEINQQISKLKEKHRKELKELEIRDAESQSNYKDMLLQAEKNRESVEADLKARCASLSETVKAKESLVLSLMSSIQEKDETFAAKEAEWLAKFEQLERDNSSQLSDLKLQMMNQRDELEVKYKSTSEKLSRIEADLLFKEEVLVQKASSDKESKEKCRELQNCLDKLEKEHKATLADFAQTSQSLDLTRKDLGVLKSGCEQLQLSIKSDRAAHADALRTEREHHALEMNKVKDGLVRQLNAALEQSKKEKAAIQNSLSLTNSQLSDKISSLEKRHSLEREVYLRDLRVAAQQKTEMERCLQEKTESMAGAVEKSRGEASALENKIKEANVAQKQLEKKVTELEQELDGVKQKLASEIKRKETLEASLNEVEINREELVVTIADCKLKHNKTTEELENQKKINQENVAQHQQETANLNSKMNELEQTKESLTKEMHSQQEKYTKECSEVVALLSLDRDARARRLRSFVNMPEKQDSSDREKAMSAIYKTLESIHCQHEEELSKLKNNLTDQRSEFSCALDSHKEDLKQVCESRAALELELSAAKESLDGTQKEKADLQKLLQEHSSGKAQLNVQLVELEEQVKVFKSRLEEKQCELLEMSKDQENSSTEIGTLRARIEELSTECENAKAALNRTNADHCHLIKQKEDKEKEVNVLFCLIPSCASHSLNVTEFNFMHYICSSGVRLNKNY